MLDFGSLVSRVIKSTWLFQCKILRKSKNSLTNDSNTNKYLHLKKYNHENTGFTYYFGTKKNLHQNNKENMRLGYSCTIIIKSLHQTYQTYVWIWVILVQKILCTRIIRNAWVWVILVQKNPCTRIIKSAWVWAILVQCTCITLA